jgi:photosystem II stability/assembly factor-like uncharacterized protein
VRFVAGLLIAFVLTYTASARANGRFPQAQQIVHVPGDPSTVYLRATFGILQSKDGGQSWRWICEKALGYEGQWDPSIAATRDGRLWVGLETGVASSADGCKFERAPELEGETVKDITTDGKGETVYLATGAPGKTGHVWRHRPGATSWEKLWPLEDVNVMTIDVAPSNPQRVYLSGESYSTIRGQIYRSDDGGLTFKTDKGDGGASASGLKADGPLFIGAIDNRDPNRLLVRHLHAHGSDLLLSKDGGKTFENVLSMKSAMFGFAFADDGKTYWAGSGLKEDGLFRSDDRGATFHRVANEGVLCLHSAPTTLFICGNPFSYNQTTIARSDDRGATVTPIAKFSDIQGPLECTNVCAEAWPTTKQAIVSPPVDSAAASDLPPDAGRKKKRRRDAGTDDAAAAPDQPSSRCGCKVVGAPTNRAPGAALFLLLAGAVIARKVRRG